MMLYSRISSTAVRRLFQSTSSGFQSSNKRLFASGKSSKFFVINAVGIDRPGIVSDLCEVVTDAGGNIGESRALRLGEHFTLMMLADVPEQESRSVQESLAHVKGIYASTFETRDPNAVTITPKTIYKGKLYLNGADNPGIVHKVTSVLSDHRLNIENLETSQKEAPFGGTTLFLMNCSVTATEMNKDTLNMETVRKDLSKLADFFNCDIDVEDL